jgi:FixJ family two-component response regulator
VKQVVHVVDDDESFLRSMSRLLQAAGYEVRTYGSADEFAARFDAETPGCVLTDLQMPGRSGLDLQEMVAKSANPLPVVFITGRGDIPTSVRAMRGGAEDFLTKRSPKAALMGAVARAIERDADDRASRERRHVARERLNSLTQREREVLAGVVRGQLNKQIAKNLGLAERTVKFHRTAFTRKLGLSSAAQLAMLVRDAGLTTDDFGGRNQSEG